MFWYFSSAAATYIGAAATYMGDKEQLIMGRLRIRTIPVQLGSAKAGTELGNKSK